ncbi:MAG: helix-turn-helix transcriptional regulator [Sphingomonas bacterium]
MKVVVTLDVMMARRKMKGKDLAERVGITETNLSLLKQGRVKGIRFETLAAICACLECVPGDLLSVEAESHNVPAHSETIASLKPE